MNKNKQGISQRRLNKSERNELKNLVKDESFTLTAGFEESEQYIDAGNLILYHFKDAINNIEKIEEIEKIIQQSKEKEIKKEENEQPKEDVLAIIERIVKDNPQNIKIDEKILVGVLDEWKAKEFERLAKEWKNLENETYDFLRNMKHKRASLRRLSGVKESEDYQEDEEEDEEVKLSPSLIFQPKKKSKEWEKFEESWKNLVEILNKLDDLELADFNLISSLDNIEEIEGIKRRILYIKKVRERSIEKKSPEEITRMKEMTKKLEEAIKDRSKWEIHDWVLNKVEITDKITKGFDEWEMEEWEKAKKGFGKLFENYKKLNDFATKVNQAFYDVEFTLSEIRKKEDWAKNLIKKPPIRE